MLSPICRISGINLLSVIAGHIDFVVEDCQVRALGAIGDIKGRVTQTHIAEGDLLEVKSFTFGVRSAVEHLQIQIIDQLLVTQRTESVCEFRRCAEGGNNTGGQFTTIHIQHVCPEVNPRWISRAAIVGHVHQVNFVNRGLSCHIDYTPVLLFQRN